MIRDVFEVLRDDPDACATVRCSVVVPTYRRQWLLERVLGALARQTLPRHEYEIIVCDDAQCDATRDFVERWRTHHAVSVVYCDGHTPKLGPAAMRNQGWQLACGDVIAFTDDDTVPDPDWLRQGLLALESAGADAASGRIVVPLPNAPTDYERDAARLDGAGFVTANCFCRRWVLEAVGGFDTRFRAAWREDSDLFFKLVEGGFEVVQADQAVVVRPVRPAPWGVSLRAEAKHIFDALLYKKHPGLYTKFIKPDRPYLYYAIMAFLAIALIGTAADSRVLFVAGFAGWVGATVALVARRLSGTIWSVGHVSEVVVTSLIVPFLSVFHRVRGGLLFRVRFW